MRIRKGDQVLIIKGKDRGKKAKVLRSFPRQGQILLEGVNLKKIHKSPKKEGEKGQVVEVPFPLEAGKAKLICPKCGQAVRIGCKISGKNKARICKKCQAEL